MVHGPEFHRGTVAIATAHGIIEDRFARLAGRTACVQVGWAHLGISLNRSPPCAVAVGSDSTISTVTASTGTAKFFTTASVMSFTRARFWSSVRPLTAWTYISGISISLDVLDAAL